jgi:hypothetical protein
MYKQCEFTRPAGDGGASVVVGWIPAASAAAGAAVRLKDAEAEAWSDGWTIARVSGAAVDARVLERNARDHVRTRRGSDV